MGTYRSAVEIEHLRKTYGTLVAVDGVSVEGLKSDEVSVRVRGEAGSAVQQVGWKVLDVAPPAKKGADAEKMLPAGLATGQPQDVVGAEALKKKTRPPKRFTEATLLTAMETAGKTLSQLLDEFAHVRSASLDQLRAFNLQPADLERRGRHPAFGPVTLSQLLATWVGHDLTHLHQMSRTMAHQYRDEVGPWTAYLGVMHCNAHSQ